MKFSKKIVTLIIIMNILFTIAVLYIFAKTYSEPYGLVGAWFTFTTAELWSLAGIKKKEVNKEETELTYLNQVINYDEDYKGD